MKKRTIFSIAAFLSLSGHGCVTRVQRDYPIKPVEFTQVAIQDDFWLHRMETNQRVTIPFAFQKCEETGRIDNFAKAGGIMEGDFEGRRYNDSDVFKVMEGAAYSLQLYRDPELEKYMDDLIAKVAAAQEADGYLFTTRTINPDHVAPGSGEERWSNLGSSHELYNVGHMYEAAVAYYQATGKREFLDVALKNANLIDRIFGPGKKRGYPGHQEIEIGLVKLYRITGEDKYLNLAKYFLDERGRIDHYLPEIDSSSPFAIYSEYSYLQAHQPVVEQTEAVGHAVRAAYMYSGMADVASLTGDESFIKAIDTIWENVVSKKLYLTGGIGARHHGEAFGDDYELPNATSYNETCAAIANVFWNHRLFLLHGHAKYMDVLERTLYNGLLSGISLSGDLFFYPNPLESDGKYPFNQGERTRKPWFDCACCPVNLARFIPSIPRYIYGQKEKDLYINLFIQSRTNITVDKTKVEILQETRYPWQGDIAIAVNPDQKKEFALNIRIPGWARNEPVPSDLYTFQQPTVKEIVLKVNEKPLEITLSRGYAYINRTWQKGDVVRLSLPMPVQRIQSHEKVEENKNRAALQRGPLVYCFESKDNGKVVNRTLSDKTEFIPEFDSEMLGGIVVLNSKSTKKDQQLKAIPYYAWSHRGIGEMTVWMKRGE